MRLLETTFIRVGNEEYACSNDSYGLTTFENRHVAFAAGEVRFHFRGKSGVSHQVAVHDRRVARIIRRCRDLPGQELFEYLDAAGDVNTIDSADVDQYIHEIVGGEFTAKDFRTWAGTVLAIRAFQEIGGSTQKEVVRAIAQVAEQLGNTPAVCRKCYVHPRVIVSYLEGTLTEGLRPSSKAGARRLPRHGLRAEELSVLRLLARRS